MDQAPRARHLCWRHRGEVPGDLRYHSQSLPAVCPATGSHIYNLSLAINLRLSIAKHVVLC